MQNSYDNTLKIEKASILKNQNFLFLWLGALLSGIAISFFTFSQTWYIVKTLNLEASLGIVLVATSVPRLLLMIVGGALADKFPKNRIMVTSNIFRMLLVLGLILLLQQHTLSLLTFTLFGIMFGILDAFFWSADGSILPEIIRKDQLTEANSITQMTNQSSLIIGPIIAGFMIKLGTYETVFTMSAILLLLSAICIFFMKLPKKEITSDKETSMLTSIKEGILYVKESPFISALLFCSVFINLFLIGPMQIGFPLFAKNVLNGDSVTFSYLESSVAVGMAIGAIGVVLLRLKKKRGIFCLTMLLLAGAFFFALSFTSTLWMSLGMGVLFGISVAAAAIPMMAILQMIVSENMMGRVMSLMMLSSMGLIPVSYGLTSIVLYTGIGIQYILATGAIFVILFALYAYISIPAVRNFN
ncbi:MFS transporter [Priestia taiwanensis]|uniref:MFS transporter n=1 Tax=Priestia taiwanensis TaxID=1347902 RepID=A0A917AY77_9BACI|nr:MFS transporter [Priestia taiwanensis]MBM7364595.1 MFS family permease [Priestia taiwanensis]GGE80258.1 MFS transporter [Priestia taiwanensis]